MLTKEEKQKIDNNKIILDNNNITVNGIKTDIVRDFWLMAKESGYDDITDGHVGLHIARCLNRMCNKYGYTKFK